MRVIWSPLSLERVEETARAIAADRPAAADRWVRAVFDRLVLLRDYPESGSIVPEFGRTEIRELAYPPYRIIYRLDPKRIVILTIRHGRQKLDPEDVVGGDEP